MQISLRRPSAQQINRIGIHTSKHVFQPHGVDSGEEPVLRKKLRRKEMIPFFEKLPPRPLTAQILEPKRPAAVLDAAQLRSQADLAKEQLAKDWCTLAWRKGTDTELSSGFAAVRLRPASRDYNRPQPYPEQWLLNEWPPGESEPTKYSLSTLGTEMSIDQLVDNAKLR